MIADIHFFQSRNQIICTVRIILPSIPRFLFAMHSNPHLCVDHVSVKVNLFVFVRFENGRVGGYIVIVGHESLGHFYNGCRDIIIQISLDHSIAYNINTFIIGNIGLHVIFIRNIKRQVCTVVFIANQQPIIFSLVYIIQASELFF